MARFNFWSMIGTFYCLFRWRNIFRAFLWSLEGFGRGCTAQTSVHQDLHPEYGVLPLSTGAEMLCTGDFCFWPGVLSVFLYFGVLGYIWALFVEFGPANTGTFIFGTGATWCEGATRRCCFLFSHYFWAFLVFWVDNGIFSWCMKFEGQ